MSSASLTETAYSWLGRVLDYSEESLEGVDELLGRESFIGRTPRKPQSPDDSETLWSCSKMFGGYVGEVTLRTLGGRWLAHPLENGEVRLAIEALGVKGFPVSKVWKRLTESEFDTVSGYCRAIRAIAAPKK